VYWAEDHKKIYFLFELEHQDDTMIVYAYDCEKQKFIAKFNFSMA